MHAVASQMIRMFVRPAASVTAAVLLLLALPPTVVRADGETIEAGSIVLNGEPATVPIRLTGFERLGAMTVSVKWDAALVRVALSDGTLAGGAIMGNPDVDNPVAISYFSATGFTGNGVLANLTLTPLSEGTGTVELSVIVCVDIDASAITPQLRHGIVTVSQAASPGASTVSQGTTSGNAGSTVSPGSDPAASLTPGASQTALLTASDLSVTPTQASPDQEVVVSANICNSGEERGSKTVSLLLNGEAVASQSVSVSGGACQQVSFKTSRAVPGTYQVAIDGMTGQFSVLAPGTVTPNAPSQQQTGLGTAGIIAIIAVLIAIIAVLIMVFKRD